MRTIEIIAELTAERDRLDDAISILRGHRKPGRRPLHKYTFGGLGASSNTQRPRRHLSIASKKRISEAMKARWSKARKEGRNSLAA